MGMYSVKQLSKLSGVSVRTLHHYDKLGLLKPLVRTEAKYRQYGEKELLRLQQILFYKELDFPLQEIADVLDDPEFDMLWALEQHKTALQAKQSRLHILLSTLDKTIFKLKGMSMINDEELYKGLPKEKGPAYRKEAVEKYGEEPVTVSENYLKKLSSEELENLKNRQAEIWERLRSLTSESPENDEVQKWIGYHYQTIRQFWGTAHTSDPQWEAYQGLGELYVSDGRFTSLEGVADPKFASFLEKAIVFFVKRRIQ